MRKGDSFSSPLQQNGVGFTFSHPGDLPNGISAVWTADPHVRSRHHSPLSHVPNEGGPDDINTTRPRMTPEIILGLTLVDSPLVETDPGDAEDRLGQVLVL